ncbi:hypothetical protein Aduo_016166 [Ancylostoma duodenale]
MSRSTDTARYTKGTLVAFTKNTADNWSGTTVPHSNNGTIRRSAEEYAYGGSVLSPLAVTEHAALKWLVS